MESFVMVRMKRFLLSFFLIVAYLTFFGLAFDLDQEVSQEERSKVGQPEDIPEIIIPAPKSIRESIGIYVFVAWMWLCILVLIFVLRLKIKEVDRLNRLKFFSTERK